MDSRTRKWFARLLEPLFTCAADGDDGGSGGEGQGNDPAGDPDSGGEPGGSGEPGEGGEGESGGGDAALDDGTQEVFDPRTYQGGADFNPDSRPLKLPEDQRLDFTTKDEFDEFLGSLDPAMRDEMLMSDDEIADLGEAMARADGVDLSKPMEGEEGEDGEGEEGDKGGEGAPAEPDDKAFLESLGMDAAKFGELPEKAQQALAKGFLTGGGGAETDAQRVLREERDKLQNTVDNMMKHPLVAAVAEEQRTGKQFVARPNEVQFKMAISDQDRTEIDTMMENGDWDKVEAKLTDLANKAASGKAAELIARERGVAQQNETQRAETDKFVTMLKGLKEMNPELDFTDEDVSALKSGLTLDGRKGEYMKWFDDNGISMSQANKMGTKGTYAGFAASVGLDRAEKQQIHDNAVKDLLKRVLHPETARDVPPVRSSQASQTAKTVSMEVDDETLIAELVAGNRDRFDNLVRANEFNGDRLDELERIEERATLKMRDLARQRHAETTSAA